MPRLRSLALVTVLAMAASAIGETVYLRDGRTLVGKVTKRDGKIKIEMPYGTVIIDRSDVIYIGQGEPKTRPSAPLGVDDGGGNAVEWNPTRATLPEPLLFMAERRVELLPESMSYSARQELEQWRTAVHDRKRKVGGAWLTPDQQRRRRAEFEKRIRRANEKARQAVRRYERTTAGRARQRRLQTEAREELQAAARVWPDTVIRDFLVATLNLRHEAYARAEEGFRRCVRAQPLVAAFHQGRGYALLGLKRPLDALEEFALCLRLRDDTYQTIKLVQNGMKEVPGRSIKELVYTRARELVDRYEKPTHEYRSYSRGTSWLMPGAVWTAREGTLFTGPYDRVVAKQALGVPVSENGLLLVDRGALAGAHLIYVEVAPGRFARAQFARQIWSGLRSASRNIPLAPIAVRGVTFTPVDLAKPAPLKADQAVTIRAANLYRQMGTQLRQGQARVRAVDDGTPQLDSALLPGEAVGAAFVAGKFAGFLTARDKPEQAGCGKSTFVKPAELAAWAAKLNRYLKSRSSYRSYRGPALKPDAPKTTAEGQAFLVHILVGEKPPEKLLK